MDDVVAIVESVFRNESGRIIAGLIRAARSFDLAEEALQDAFAAAVANWQSKGVPENPAAWITAAAHRKLIDYARRAQTRRNKECELLHQDQSSCFGSADEDMSVSFEDDRLRLIFTCCHPALNREARVALTLRTLGGLTTPEIARAFLVSEATLAQRLTRAKRKIQEARIPYEVPPPERLVERLSAVQSVLYLIFNEGYVASAGDSLVRRELCAEAIHLARVLLELMPTNPENMGLLALMLLHDSRSEARCTSDGELVPLEEQDRSRWRQDQIAEGRNLVERALGRRNAGPYQIQAAIAAIHAEAKTAEETDWKQIAGLYAVLATQQPSPVVFLNQAVAIAMSEGLECGLAMLDELGSSGDLDNYYLFHAARAELLRRMARTREAIDTYERALALTTNTVECRYLRRRIAEAAGEG
ncbi:MAG TPA: RNA polymerase sigma factor [Bryobacteraceae bacterium]|nr:RNA polymerase sigma factor [Bryobacteraceae bacterium]